MKKHLFWPFLTMPGKWDRIGTVPELARVEQMRELFIDKLPTERTKAYQNLVAELAANGFTRFPRTRSLEEINKYFERVRRVYQSIKDDGYKTYIELGHPRANEIFVRITRDGRLVKAGEGTHRLAMASILGMETVPVVVDLVHSGIYSEWKKASRGTGQDPIRFGIELLNARAAKING